jgi:hypothetical protein
MEGCKCQQARSSKRIEAFSVDFQAEEDVYFIKNSKGCTMAQVEVKTVMNELSHPAGGKAWTHFNKTWPNFAKDARNLRLCLATDGFNRFGNMTNSYSMWPVFVVSYNMPPWVCMEESNFMMAILIPWPSSSIKGF